MEKILAQIREWFNSLEVEISKEQVFSRLLMILIAAALAWGFYTIVRRIVLRIVEKIAKKTKTKWDDILIEQRVFRRLSHLAPALVIYGLAPIIFVDAESMTNLTRLAAQVYILIVGLFVADSLLNAFVEICRPYPFSKRLPIRGFAQLVKVIVFFAGGLVAIALLIDQSPLTLLGGLGAMTAVLMLIFKDTILGFVAGIILSTNNMVQVGDWIEMPKYGADGDVIDITLTTVKVHNWDKTYSTIPAYALISDSFKNWRGMSESGGRRIKRNIHIDMTSIKFCTEEMLTKFRQFKYITEYLEKKKEEIATYNREQQVDDSVLVNGRRLTNIGTFRAYIVEYLRHHPKIHKNMTFLVRHLEPTAQGLPIQIYVFSNDQVWANYEGIQADIFDHILAVIPEFELRVFQNPTGADFSAIVK